MIGTHFILKGKKRDFFRGGSKLLTVQTSRSVKGNELDSYGKERLDVRFPEFPKEVGTMSFTDETKGHQGTGYLRHPSSTLTDNDRDSSTSILSRT